MPSRPALLDAADVVLATGIIAGTVQLAAGADAAPPEWIRLTPKGPATTRDGRTFTFNPAALAARFRADGVDLAVDTDHSVALLGSKGLTPNVVGYVKQAEARDDGTWGRVDWIDPAAAKKQLRTHRYVSPTLHHDAAGTVTWLHSVALVSAPALGNMGALAHASAHQDSPMKEIAKALGLPETATEPECLAALRGRVELKPLAAALGLTEAADAAALLQAATTLKAGGSGLVTELQGQVSTLGARVQTSEKALRDRDVAELLDGALRDRKIVPAQRESYAAMCASDDGLKGVRQLLAATPAALAPSGLDGLTPPSGDAAVDPVMLAAQGRKLKAEVEAAGGSISIADAITRVQMQARKG